MAAHVRWRAQSTSRSSFRNQAKHATPLEGCSPGWLEGSDAHRALNKSEHLGRRERSRRARARAARSYLQRPLLHGATNGGAEVGRRKDANSDARYRAQKHAADQALLAILATPTNKHSRAKHMRGWPTPTHLSARLSSAHTKIGTSFLVRVSYLLKILSGPADSRYA